jgi:hypothetical protein
MAAAKTLEVLGLRQSPPRPAPRPRALGEVLPEALRDRPLPLFAKVWIADEDAAALVGLTFATAALAREPGGKPLRRSEDAVSRA